MRAYRDDGSGSFQQVGSALSDALGHYDIGTLPPGTYKVGFDADAYQSEFFDNSVAFASATTVTVPASGSATANSVLSPAATISGVVTDITGAPTAGITVEMWHVGPSGLELAGTTIPGLGIRRRLA